MDAPEELNEAVLPQTVVAPLTRAAIFSGCLHSPGPGRLRASAVVLRRPFRAHPRR